MKQMYQVMKELCWVGQLGLSLLMPLLLCLLLCWWAVDRFDLPLWLYIPALILGLGGGGASAKGFYRITMKKSGEKKPRGAYNRHS